MDVTVLTMAKGRNEALRGLLAGLVRGDAFPEAAVLVDLDPQRRSLPTLPFPLRHRHCPATELPLAAARNRAASEAATEGLIFLDADCIPAPELVRVMSATLDQHDALICCEVLYLPPGHGGPGAELRKMEANGVPHPHRPFPPGGLRREPNTGLFWSLAFAVRRSSFEALGGFDTAYTGYGAEDTDLAFRAAARGLPLLLSGQARVFHQHHPVYDPPLQHFADILANARRFHSRHGMWPMDGWLQEFADAGFIRWSPRSAEIRLLRQPTEREVAAALCPPDRLF
ncbi:glycosyltransferase family 2 protein [Pseudoroseomonas globiformis]|uniref:Glycosyltransferase family 2 protein n=1 Tax=Teichococcus globiformis TaxID=2307229 RepID=A0ABV7FTV9_9PROT